MKEATEDMLGGKGWNFQGNWRAETMEQIGAHGQLKISFNDYSKILIAFEGFQGLHRICTQE